MRHFKLRNIIALLCLLCITCNVSALQKERVLWDKKPIPVALVINEERILYFPSDIRYWVPASIEHAVSVLSANGVVYITAHRAFEKTRIRVQSLDNQTMYLLDLKASEEGRFPQELIITDADAVDNKAKGKKKLAVKDDWFVRLTRFAAQSLYGKERLMPSDPEIRRMNIPSEPIPLIVGGDIESIPIHSWRGGGLYVTAVRLRNLSNERVEIHHEAPMVSKLLTPSVSLSSDVRGSWLAASPQHTFLSPMNTDEDMTTLYLLSRRPFKESF